MGRSVIPCYSAAVPPGPGLNKFPKLIIKKTNDASTDVCDIIRWHSSHLKWTVTSLIFLHRDGRCAVHIHGGSIIEVAPTTGQARFAVVHFMLPPLRISPTAASRPPPPPLAPPSPMTRKRAATMLQCAWRSRRARDAWQSVRVEAAARRQRQAQIAWDRKKRTGRSVSPARAKRNADREISEILAARATISRARRRRASRAPETTADGPPSSSRSADAARAALRATSSPLVPPSPMRRCSPKRAATVLQCAWRSRRARDAWQSVWVEAAARRQRQAQIVWDRKKRSGRPVSPALAKRTAEREKSAILEARERVTRGSAHVEPCR